MVPGIDPPDSIRPGKNVATAAFTEVEEDGTGAVQQGEDARGTVRGVQVEVRHAAPEQRVSLSQVVVDVQARDHPGESPAGLFHGEELGDDVAQRLDVVVGVDK